MDKLTKSELKKIYLIIKALKEGQLTQPDEDWELDYYEERLIGKKDIGDILSKLKLLLSEEERKIIDRMVLTRKYSTFANEIDEKVYLKIEKTFASRNTVEIKYFSLEKGEPIKRKIDIYYKSRRYVITFCHLRNSIRKFRTSRIVSAKITNKKYSIPENFDKNEFL